MEGQARWQVGDLPHYDTRASRSSSSFLRSTPQRYPPAVPSLRTARWHGITIAAGLAPHAFADHNVRETLMVTDRAYIINNGKIFRAGSPDALGRDPEVRRVYLGESFSLRGESIAPLPHYDTRASRSSSIFFRSTPQR